ncbi:MAG: creatininase family protein [Verrucomicrobiia bacterium]
MKLADLTWPDVAKLKRDVVVVHPIGALEQHSRHLPFFTDSILCGAIVERVEAALPKDVLLLPVQWLGASLHHLGMAGSLSAENETYIKLIAEPMRCLLRHGFKRQFVLNGHGGNKDGFHLAQRQLAVEFPGAQLCGANYWDVATEEIAKIVEGPMKSIGHACEAETAMMLAVRPDLVRRDAIHNDLLATRQPKALRGVYVALDMKAQTQHGGIGYAELATAEKGARLLDAIVMRLIEVIRTLRKKQV